MRRTQWAVFTSMNPRPSAWRALYETDAAEQKIRSEQDGALDVVTTDPEPRERELPDQRLRA